MHFLKIKTKKSNDSTFNYSHIIW